MRNVVIGLLVAIMVWAMTLAVAEMPPYGEINPTFNYVYEYYIGHGVAETGAVNIVTQILADYRAYNTLIETVVLFTAIMAALLVLRTPPVDEG